MPDLTPSQWIWAADPSETCELRKGFTLEAAPTSATLLITADNGYRLRVNGAEVGSDEGAESEVWQSVERYDLTGRLIKGRNIVGIRGLDLGGIRGVVAALRLEFENLPVRELVTDASWRASAEPAPVDPSHPEYVEDATWTAARVVGPWGMSPWGKVSWSEGGVRTRSRAPSVDVVEPDSGFAWPGAVAFLGDDCSVYVPLRADAWGVAFRVGDWSRAYTEFDLPCPAKIGRKLYTLTPGPDATPHLLVDAGPGAIGSPSAAFDGRSLLISMARGGDRFFHIYRVPTDGGEPTRLTDGPFHDLDPVELPDGRIVFASTRAGTFEEYHQPPSRALFRMKADGTDLHPITSTLIFDNEPKVMADGRLAFIRTDNFFDRGKVETQLHVIRPDGTDGHAEIAANVGADYGVRLRAFGYGSPAPLPDGRLAFISSHGNFVASTGGRPSDFVPLPGPVGDLVALPDGRLLATVLRADGRRMTSEVLGVVRPGDTNVVRIFQSREGSIHSPISIVARPRPPVIPDYVDRAQASRPGATGFLLCQDARLTSKSKAGWDRIRAIRVLGAIPLTTRSSHSHIVHVGHETVELGTVPLAPDGSFFVEVPADMPLALQAVDAEGRSELNEMSWLYVRPGERRSCVGCHQPRQSTPAFTGSSPDALRAPPLKLLGQGDPHRFRGNNPGVTGMMDLQFERFRECASLNRCFLPADPNGAGPTDVAELVRRLEQGTEPDRISAAQRLALLRERTAAAALAPRLREASREVRVAAALALATCGTRDSVPPLVSVLGDRDPVVVQAARLALENLTGTAPLLNDASLTHPSGGWDSWESDRVRQIASAIPLSPTNPPPALAAERATLVALGHTGGEAGRLALRTWVRAAAAHNPYPAFEQDNRTDTFTFAAGSAYDPRTLQEAVRALGHLRDTTSVPLLAELLRRNLEPRTANLFLTEAVVESLGRIGTREAEQALIRAFDTLQDYWHYVGWYSDHPALYACHASPVHARLIEALDRLASTGAAPLVPQLIRSVPTDPDRALFLANDAYETMVGRLIRRSGRGPDVWETCLALLGDPEAVASPDIRTAITHTHPAWAGHPGPENRAAQILSLAALDPALEPRVRAAFTRFVQRPEEPILRTLGNPSWTPVRHWTLFYLARALGNLGQAASVDTLVGVLRDDLNEARHGRPDPSTPEIHFLHLDYTPCWRAASAWALGQIGEARAVPAL
ncbi:MAG: HEAT repeat domain-containing protein, partial [Verrucomicrobiales bacterium]|nr:HEAT repeat domain-containing protein [Verrucomicrobiales bacterium]